jgi:hypothetical protein
MQHDKPNLNEGKPWSEMDLVDLKNGIQRGTLMEKIAVFQCGSEEEVLMKSAGLKADLLAPAELLGPRSRTGKSALPGR